MTTLKQMLGGNIRQYGIVGALVVIILFFEVLTDGKMLLPNNVASLIQQNAYVMILAAGMVIVIIAGHIDLSVGSIVGFVGAVVALLIANAGCPGTSRSCWACCSARWWACGRASGSPTSAFQRSS